MKYCVPDRTEVFMPSDELFCNPHKGFTTFQRFRTDELNENWTPETGWKMEELPQNLKQCDNGLKYPDTSIAYFRIPWRRLEPEDGKFDFSYLDYVLKTAWEQGQHVMLRFPAHAQRDGQLDLPEWFREKLGLAPRETGDKASPTDPLYYKRYSEFIRAVGAHIDGDKRITAIDMALVGAWGENALIDMVPEEDWKKLVDAYMQSFTKTPISAQFSHKASVAYANSYRSVGLRADCLGDMRHHMLNLYPRSFPLMDNLWKSAPIAFEVCWIIRYWEEMGWDIDYIIEQSLKWHITSFNAKSAPTPPLWADKLEGWIKKMGYRYSVRRVDYPTQAQAGDILKLYMWIENRGVAPIYHKYPFTLRLRGESATFDFITDADITKWLPGDILWDGDITLPQNIPAGMYSLEAGIGDADTKIRIATKSPETDNFRKIGEIRIDG